MHSCLCGIFDNTQAGMLCYRSNDAPGGPECSVVDDDRSLRESVAGNIKSWGFNVEQASDGPGCAPKTETFAPNLVVTT